MMRRSKLPTVGWSREKRHALQVRLDKLLEREDWYRARQLLQAALKYSPDDHWLISRIGLTYYEDGKYRVALRHQIRAAKLAPGCSLVKWELAGCLDMLRRDSEAAQIYRSLSRASPRLARKDGCFEGVVWLRGLAADSLFRLSMIMERNHRLMAARRHLEKYLIKTTKRASTN